MSMPITAFPAVYSHPMNKVVFQVTVHPSIHPSIHRSMGPAPVGAQCPLASSLGEFLGYRDFLWYPGLSPLLLSIALAFAFHISMFSIHSSSPAIGFHSSIFLRWQYLHPTTNPPPHSRLEIGRASCR